jgi:hypothetical protein
MSYDPTNPGPVLDTYDPNWEARFDAIHAELKIVQDGDWFLRDHDRAKQLTEELIAAHEAQYEHISQYAAAHYGHHCLGALPDDPPELYVPAPPHAVTRAQVQAYFADLGKARVYWRFLASLPPALEWGTGVFAQTPPADVTPTVDEAIIKTPPMETPVRMTLVVEHHRGVTHVCAVQGPEDLASITNNLDLVADYIAERYLPRPRLLSRLWSRLRGEPAPRLMFHYTYTPTPDGPPPQPVWSYELQWAHSLGRAWLQRDELETQQATPVLRELSLALAPEARSGRTLH